VLANGNIEIEQFLVHGYQETKTRNWMKHKLQEIAGDEFVNIVNIDATKAERFMNNSNVPLSDVLEFIPGTQLKTFKIKPPKDDKGVKTVKKKKGAEKDECGNKNDAHGWVCTAKKGHKSGHTMHFTNAAGVKTLQASWTNIGEVDA